MLFDKTDVIGGQGFKVLSTVSRHKQEIANQHRLSCFTDGRDFGGGFQQPFIIDNHAELLFAQGQIGNVNQVTVEDVVESIQSVADGNRTGQVIQYVNEIASEILVFYVVFLLF